MYKYCIAVVVTLLIGGCGGDKGQGGNNNNGNNSAVCGNGVQEAGEDCDDGSANSDTEPDACRPGCVRASCGDGVADSDEDCDGDDHNGAICADLSFNHGSLSCDLGCTFVTDECAFCGDGVAEGTNPTGAGYEVCDGSDIRGQDCVSVGQAEGDLLCGVDCGWDFTGCVGGAECRNGIKEQGEECDDGNEVACDGCSVDCVEEFCGNGISECGEQCDDSNGVSGDGCSANCMDEVCGNGVVDASEICDDGNVSDCDGCRGDCTAYETGCGDGFTCGAEACDDGGNVDCDGCRSNCLAVETGCGDGFVCGSEVCDDGNIVVGDGCGPSCQPEACGNGLMDPGEICDDGNTVAGDGCGPACLLEVCGNGYSDPGEACDDGNVVDCDGCRGDCSAVESGCGDGFLCGGEACDDGNNDDCDLCRGNCLAVETGCGDGFICGSEVCDDGNTAAGDGCGPLCLFEECGNSYQDPGENCDDGNTAAGDGCGPSCLTEVCGNNYLDPGEVCDGNVLAGQDCTDYGWVNGPGLACASDCQSFVSTGCLGVCGNGTAEPDEVCEVGDLKGADCASELHPGGGNLTCTASCTFDTSQCCQDNDGDGWGAYCTLGIDCDDNAPGIVDVCQADGCPLGWIFVPGGVFEMGCDSGDPCASGVPGGTLLNEGMRHTVTLTQDYCMQPTEVSVADYRACSLSGMCPCDSAAVGYCPFVAIGVTPTPQEYVNDPAGNPNANWCNWTSSPSGRENHPINCIQWGESRWQCDRWFGGDLPTEAQWERAARWNDQRAYPWGTTAPTCADANVDPSSPWVQPYGCNQVNTGPGTWPVNPPQGSVSQLGLYNMAGNVSEWTLDSVGSQQGYGDFCVEIEPPGDPDPLYCGSPCDCVDPTNTHVTGSRVIRGGAHSFPNTFYHRTTVRATGTEVYSDPYPQHYIGFRCVRTL